MSWAVGYDDTWKRWIGYGVPAFCDFPGCYANIDRGLSFVCCSNEPYGGDRGCGLYFCELHAPNFEHRCSRCKHGKEPFKPSPDHPKWLRHIWTDPSWDKWRSEQPPIDADSSLQRESKP